MTANNQQKLNQTVVTVPEFNRIDNIPLVLTDYALDNGAGCLYRDEVVDLNGKTPDDSHQKYAFGETWVRPNNNGLLGVDTCYWVRHEGARRSLRSPEDNTVGVAPCLENASADHWAVATAESGETTLTHDNKPVYYPRTRVGNELQTELSAARDGERRNGLLVMGAYHRPVRCNQDATLKSETDICYAYRGRCYVNCKDIMSGRDDWYLCEPVRALSDEITDHVQIGEVLINAPFDSKSHFVTAVKAGDYALSGAALDNFLNKSFITDLKLSTDLAKYMKLTQTKAVFANNQLKANTADLTASPLVR